MSFRTILWLFSLRRVFKPVLDVFDDMNLVWTVYFITFSVSCFHEESFSWSLSLSFFLIITFPCGTIGSTGGSWWCKQREVHYWTWPRLHGILFRFRRCYLNEVCSLPLLPFSILVSICHRTFWGLEVLIMILLYKSRTKAFCYVEI